MTDVSDTPGREKARDEKAPETTRSYGSDQTLPSAAAAPAVPLDGEAPPESSENGRRSVRLLATAPAEPALPPMSKKEREELAKKRVGSTIKGWRLARLLGVGPVCAAYESFKGADDSGDHVVLKVMVGKISTHERARGMLLRGAYASNRFSHPRVVHVASDGTDAEGAAFLVRPWVEAEPLEQVVARTEAGLGEAQVLRIAEQVLDALEIAHAHGIVHGALTPRNILVTPRGSVRLCDFSVPPGMGPRTSDEEDLLAALRVDAFSAPERCGSRSKPASEQTDLYMLAACMFFAVSKETPRGAASAPDALAKERARPLRDVCPRVGESFAALVDHALSREPEGRFESAYAMLGDVRRVMAGRKPKLADARRPVPSGSYGNLALSTSRDTASVRPPASMRGELTGPISTGARAAPKDQWKGNVALILAIALLVGVATFVMVREKVEEAREQDRQEQLKQQERDQATRDLQKRAAPRATGGDAP